MSVRRKSGETRGACLTLSRGVKEEKLGCKPLDCSEVLGKVWTVYQGVPIPSLPIKGYPHLPCLASDPHQSRLAVLGHWLGEVHVKCGLSVNVVINFREQQEGAIGQLHFG